METLIRAQVVSVAQSFLGVPYLHRGRSRAGVDCVGLVYCVGTEVGLLSTNISHLPNYPPHVNSSILFLELGKHLRRISYDDALSGDVVVLRTGQHPGHCGILVRDGLQRSMIHSSVNGASCVGVQNFTPSSWGLVVAAFQFGERAWETK